MKSLIISLTLVIGTLLNFQIVNAVGNPVPPVIIPFDPEEPIAPTQPAPVAPAPIENPEQSEPSTPAEKPIPSPQPMPAPSTNEPVNEEPILFYPNNLVKSQSELLRLNLIRVLCCLIPICMALIAVVVGGVILWKRKKEKKLVTHI